MRSTWRAVFLLVGGSALVVVGLLNGAAWWSVLVGVVVGACASAAYTWWEARRSVRAISEPWWLTDSRPAVPQYRGKLDPVHPCRVMPTRHCPAIYNGVCGRRPCARFESQDPTPWLAEIGSVTQDP